MITYIPSRNVGAGIRGEVESFNKIGPHQTVIEPLTLRCSRLIKEAIEEGHFLKILDKMYMVNRIVEVEIEDQTKTKVKLERIEKI